MRFIKPFIQKDKKKGKLYINIGRVDIDVSIQTSRIVIFKPFFFLKQKKDYIFNKLSLEREQREIFHLC